MSADGVLDWLLAGDPAIRWQALRDLAGAGTREVAREQRRVASEGWGAKLLSLQDADGRWARGIYTPKWTSTTYTLLLLRDMGLESGNAEALRGCRRLVTEGFWSDGGINYYPSRANRSETCITAMVLSIACWFGLEDERLDRLAQHLIECQMPDGGWNCRARPGSGGATHGSFHTTISTMEGLRLWGGTAALRPLQRGEEFLLAHRLFRSHRTGAVANPVFTRFHFPPRWHYDVLRGLDYFRACGAPRDPRMEDAIELVRNRRGNDGRWNLDHRYSGKVFFHLEPLRRPSRWNTLRALRVLRWWEDI
jgi:hypothetical protein